MPTLLSHVHRPINVLIFVPLSFTLHPYPINPAALLLLLAPSAAVLLPITSISFSEASYWVYIFPSCHLLKCSLNTVPRMSLLECKSDHVLPLLTMIPWFLVSLRVGARVITEAQKSLCNLAYLLDLLSHLLPLALIQPHWSCIRNLHLVNPFSGKIFHNLVVWFTLLIPSCLYSNVTFCGTFSEPLHLKCNLSPLPPPGTFYPLPGFILSIAFIIIKYYIFYLFILLTVCLSPVKCQLHLDKDLFCFTNYRIS